MSEIVAAVLVVFGCIVIIWLFRRGKFDGIIAKTKAARAKRNERIDGIRRVEARLKEIEKKEAVSQPAYEMARKTGVDYDDALAYMEQEERNKKVKEALHRAGAGLQAGLKNISENHKKNKGKQAQPLFTFGNSGNRGNQSNEPAQPLFTWGTGQKAQEKARRRNKKAKNNKQIVINVGR